MKEDKCYKCNYYDGNFMMGKCSLLIHEFSNRLDYPETIYVSANDKCSRRIKK